MRASDVVFTIRKVIEEESVQFAGFFTGIVLDKLRHNVAPVPFDLAGARALLDQAGFKDKKRETDPARRREAYHRLHAMLAADQPYPWTLQLAQKWAVNERVRNVEVSKGFGLFLWNPGARAWWIAR